MLASRAATFADVKKHYPDQTASFRAWVVELDGEAKGIIGLALTRPFACLISSFEPELRPHLKRPAVLRLIKKTEAAIKASRLPVRAIADPNEPTAPGLLSRMGFEPLGKFAGDEIWEWSPD